MTKKTIMLLVSGILIGSWGCAPNARLVTKVDLLEHELADQRSKNSRLESRLDEIQIQLSLMARKLGVRKAGSLAAHGQAMPDLKVVKLSPDPPELKLHSGSTQSRRRPRQTRAERTLPRVEPAEVTERLTVDRHAARKPLVDPQEVRRIEDQEKQALDDNKKLAARFQRAFGLYRVNELDRAAQALTGFAKDHPEDGRSPDALFYAGKARMMLGQVGRAEKRFLQVAKTYPKKVRSAEALLLAGRCQERQGRSDDARGTYLQLVDAFPLSKQANEANKRLQSIR